MSAGSASLVVQPSDTAPAAHTSGACRLCGAGLKHTLVDLGKSPLCETFLSEQQIDQMEPFFPLHVLICDNCWLAQLKEYVAADGIFTDQYPYYSSYSTSWVAHAKAYCEMIAKRRSLAADAFVVELASNDGYLLQHFAPLGVPNILGVEPSANVAEEAARKGIPVLVDFFGKALAEKIVAEKGQADVVLGNNVLAHVPDLNDFFGGAVRLVKPDGVITFEFPHLETLLRENQFDTIYHEHFCYFSATAIAALAKRHGVVFVDVEELPTHGGSLRVYLAKSGTPSKAVVDMLAREEAAGFKTLAFYAGFDARVKRTKRKLLSFLIEAKEQGKKIVGYGAPGKGNTLLNYCGISTDFLDFTVDRNPHKHGRYTPGTHIPILPVEAIDDAKPDYILILPWNLRKEIVAQMRHVEAWGAKFVVPIPEATIIDPKE
ncbi:MAG: class I SAM-dependent methyltransferase [Hyphomonadaceae bacterium]|nr:class I SAM-dependent methyltransferase [Hyphomonadaceae bacterium]MBP9233579.1 class I SAM-dependent methyltransferase [Hyphomonadaceae bacterium]